MVCWFVENQSFGSTHHAILSHPLPPNSQSQPPSRSRLPFTSSDRHWCLGGAEGRSKAARNREGRRNGLDPWKYELNRYKAHNTLQTTAVPLTGGMNGGGIEHFDSGDRSLSSFERSNSRSTPIVLSIRCFVAWNAHSFITHWTRRMITAYVDMRDSSCALERQASVHFKTRYSPYSSEPVLPGPRNQSSIPIGRT